MKRKGFMSLEMLLVIGVLVAGLAGVFSIYKKIQGNNASMQVTQDIAAITNGLDRFKGATGGYPSNDVTVDFINANTNVALGAWNEGNTYVSADIGSRWKYRTVADSAFDLSTGTATGYIIISTSQAQFSSLKRTEIRDILRGKCLNGTTQLEGNPTLKVAADTSDCVLTANTVLYK